MPLNLFLTFDVESNRPGNYITCEHVPGAPGLFWIMDELERRDARGVFFVNIYEHTRYANGWMQGILREIHGRGHEVGLHCHLNPDLDFYRQNLTLYDQDGQTRIIRYGVDFIEAATGVRPVSFRSGALRVNHDTFAALARCGIGVDSSLKYFQNRNNNNDITEYLSINKSSQYGTIKEFPITVITRDHSQARLDPNSTPDLQGLIATVEQMTAAGCKNAVFMAHSFSFLLCTDNASAAIPGTSVFMTNRKSPNYVMGQDLYLKSVFSDFLRYLGSERDRIRTALFRNAAVAGDPADPADAEFVPRIPSNGLRAWPSAEKYAKHDLAASNTTPRIYRRVPKQLILHVGTWKTGSKALQKFWALNRKQLAQNGIFYPLTESAAYMRGGNRSYQSLIATSGDPDRKARLRALAAEIYEDDQEMCLISHENICNLPATELLEFVAGLSGCRFKLALYLRRQDHYAASLYNQHVKAGVAFPGSFDDHFALFRARYDYREMIERLGAVFGLDNIVVRPYEQEAFFGGSIFADFTRHVFGLELDERFMLPKRDQNARLDRDALEFKRLINGLEDAGRADLLSLGRHLIAYGERRDSGLREAFREHNLLSPARGLDILREFADGNAWVARKMLGRHDGVLFREPPPGESDAWNAYPGLSGAKAAEIAFHVFCDLRRELERRGAEVAHLDGGSCRSSSRRSANPRPHARTIVVDLLPNLKRIWKRHFRHLKARLRRPRLYRKSIPPHLIGAEAEPGRFPSARPSPEAERAAAETLP
jgi:Polysaccharide deacetylase